MVTRARDTDAEMFGRFSRRSNMEFAYNAFRMVNGHAPEVEAHDTRYWDFVRNSPAATAVRSVGAAFNSVTWVYSNAWDYAYADGASRADCRRAGMEAFCDFYGYDYPDFMEARE